MTDDEPMRRTPGISYEPDGGDDVLDFAADYARDAIDAGVEPTAVVDALRKAADEIEDLDERDHFETIRTEPADFGGGETTGVQDL